MVSVLVFSQVRSRPRYSIDKDKDVIHLSVDHMVVNEMVGHSHGSAGMAYAMAFSLFRMPRVGTKRFRLLKHLKVAPKVVVYEFACALQDYCMSRQPAHFKDTMILVDGFHWFNHV